MSAIGARWLNSQLRFDVVNTVPIRNARPRRLELVVEQPVELEVGHDRDVRRQHVVEHLVGAQVRGGQHEVADLLAVPQPAAVADHHHEVGPKHRHMVGDRLGVGRTDADVHERHAGVAVDPVVVRRHLDVRRDSGRTQSGNSSQNASTCML